jgi:hypothetical protein
MRKQSSEEIAFWNARGSTDVPPEELPLIPRPRAGLSARGAARFEGDLDARTLASPPAPPKVRRSGRPTPGDAASRREQAQDFLLRGSMTKQEREVWIAYCAGLSEREIAARAGRSLYWLQTRLLGPLKVRAGIESWNFKPPVTTRTARYVRKPRAQKSTRGK